MTEREELISDYMLQQNVQLHEIANYGGSGWRHVEDVLSMAWAMRAASGESTILDYGCGQSKLKKALRDTGWTHKVREYDPAIESKAALPRSSSLVVCTDVMEHVEEDKVDNVLRHIHELTERMAYFTVATRSANKKLPNGENAHITLHEYDWWIEKMNAVGWKEIYWRSYLKEGKPHEIRFWCVK